MAVLRLSPLALSQSRFALSPLAETLGTAIALARPRPAPWLAAWHARQLPAFTGALAADPFAAGLVGLVATTTWLPRCVAIPPPDGLRTTLVDELAAVRAVSDAFFRAELETSLAHPHPRYAADPRRPRDLSFLTGHGWGTRTAALLHALWAAHIAPEWPRRRALLERDIAHRAGLLATRGWPGALDQMSRHSTWEGPDAIRFGRRPGPDRVIGDSGMRFVPVSLATGTWLCEGPPGHYAQVYPARGAATAHTAPADATTGPGRALERLLGTGRATLLHCLRQPATSTELAARLQQSLGTVGGHLAVLRDAGLIVGTRVGRRVVYRCTERGELLAGDGDGDRDGDRDEGGDGAGAAPGD
ncbi:ArsR/SmtB family transcription factor [Streptomyces yunnanensis]|uniref:Helix-turn-helix domain-containing protein n=1 Tax=Streptomyces yunnanensis TaxID=156453 RepID=A0A9X8N8K4_9ACTN|nr:helix-turn-helix domain-containing protein [Streptomyces yunnanensis]SHN28936.1 Helix-turn-helix domain-containing protein [Streptomyces yunnanensis]